MKSEFKKVSQALTDARKEYLKKHDFSEKSKRTFRSLLDKNTAETSTVFKNVILVYPA